MQGYIFIWFSVSFSDHVQVYDDEASVRELWGKLNTPSLLSGLLYGSTC